MVKDTHPEVLRLNCSSWSFLFVYLSDNVLVRFRNSVLCCILLVYFPVQFIKMYQRNSKEIVSNKKKRKLNIHIH